MGFVKVSPTSIEGLYVVEPRVFVDTRGYFVETFNQRDLHEQGLDAHFVQDNESFSMKGVLRGLHFQKRRPQCKLVRVVSGVVFDVAVDLRPDSPSYKGWFGLELSSANHKQLYIPEGFAHGFLVMSESAILSYKVGDFYNPHDEGGIAWNDPEIGVAWPGVVGVYNGAASAEGYTLNGAALSLSEKDRRQPTLAELERFRSSAF